jgi:hypothetical protein
MNKQTAIEAASLASAMAGAFAEIEAATKASVNPHFKSKYADLGAVIEAIKPPLIKHGLFFTQHCHPSEQGVSVETMLHHASGESMSLGTLYVPANKQDPQGFGSALTYARRYGLQTGFGVPTEDDDGNAASKPIPFADEKGREKPVPLDGPHKSKTALWTAVKAFDRTLRGISDSNEFEPYLQTEEVLQLLAQCERDAPQLLSTGEGLPPEYVPLLDLIRQRRSELSQADESWKTNPVLAG